MKIVCGMYVAWAGVWFGVWLLVQARTARAAECGLVLLAEGEAAELRCGAYDGSGRLAEAGRWGLRVEGLGPSAVPSGAGLRVEGDGASEGRRLHCAQPSDAVWGRLLAKPAPPPAEPPEELPAAGGWSGGAGTTLMWPVEGLEEAGSRGWVELGRGCGEVSVVRGAEALSTPGTGGLRKGEAALGYLADWELGQFQLILAIGASLIGPTLLYTLASGIAFFSHTLLRHHRLL